MYKNNYIMKKAPILKLSILVALAIFMFQSCKKDEGTVTPVGEDTGSEVISDFFAQNAPKANKTTFDVKAGGTISGTKTSIYIGVNSLVDKDGNAITGNVDFELTEYLSKGDMAFSGVTTISGDEMLESAGMFNLMASQNGEEVFLAQGKSINVALAQASFPQEQFQIFEGQKNNKEDENKVNWNQVDTNDLQARQDSAGGSSFNFNYFKFGYCNIDRFYKEFEGNKISSFKINMPAGYDGDNSWALLLFEDYKSCAWSYWDKTDKVFKTSYSLGKGVKCKVLAVSVIDAKKKEFEYEVQNVTLTDNTEVNITNLQPITEAQIEALVKAL